MRYCVRLRHITAALLLFAILFVIPVNNVSAKAEIVVIGPPHCTIYVILHKEFHIMKLSAFDREIAELQEKIRIKQKALDALDSEAAKVGSYILHPLGSTARYLARKRIQETLDELKRDLQDLLDARAEAFVPPELEQKAQEWKKGIEDTWNVPNYEYDCCKVKFIVEIKIRDADDPPTKGFDQIGVVPAAGWRSHMGGGIGGTFDGDGFSDVPYEKDLTGRWSFDDSGRDAAHEAGHEIGLVDQYDDQFVDGKFTGSKTRKGHEKDIMGHEDGKPVDKETGIDNINTILRKRDIECPPECCKKSKTPVPSVTDEIKGFMEGRTYDAELWEQSFRDYAPDKWAEKEKAKDIDKVDEGVQYRNVKEDNTTVDAGIRYERTTDGMDIDVSAIATGKGFNFRKWEVTDMKLNIDGEKINADKSENFYVMRQSVFQGTATVVFAAIGSQYTRYVDKAGSGEVCPVTGQKIESGKEKVEGTEAAIDKAGMSAGMGLLTSQAKGEIKGRKASFTLDKDHSKKISEGKGSVEITAENKQEHERKKFTLPLAEF